MSAGDDDDAAAGGSPPAPTPYVRWEWGGKPFAPRLIAPGADAIWLIDEHLALLARIDPDASRVEGPIPLAWARRRRWASADGFATGLGAVWIRWDDAITRYDSATGVEERIGVQGYGLAVGDEGAWTLDGWGRAVRVDPGPEAAGSAGAPRAGTSQDHVAVGHGWVWATCVEAEHAVTTLTRIEPASGAAHGSLRLEGSAQRLIVDEVAVWVEVWVTRRSRIHSHLVRIEPDKPSVSGDLALEPAGAAMTVHKGVVWISSADPYRPGTSPSVTMRRLDGAGGELIEEAPVPGSPEWLVAGPAGVWGCLVRDGASAPAVVGFAADLATPVVVELGSLDVARYVPPPPGPIRVDDSESAAREALAHSLLGGWVATAAGPGEARSRPFIKGVTFDEVRLEGSFPRTEVVALFRSAQHPGIRFGRRWRVWEDDGELVDLGVADINLMEEVEASGYGLPPAPVPGPDGVCWF